MDPMLWNTGRRPGHMRICRAVLLCLLTICTDVAFGADLDTVAAYFEQAKKNEAELIAFLHKMPKGGDLHNHPGGAIYGESVIDRAVSDDFLFDRREKRFVKRNAPLPAAPQDLYFTPQDIVRDYWKSEEILDGISMRHVEKRPEGGVEHFFQAFGRYGGARPDKEAQLDEVIRRALAQRVSYMELMTTPSHLETSADVAKYAAWQRSLDLKIADMLNSPEYRDISRDLALDVAFTLTVDRAAVPSAQRQTVSLGGHNLTVSPSGGAAIAPGKDFANASEASFRHEVASALDRLRAVDAVSDDGRLRVYGLTIVNVESSWMSRHFFDMHMRVLDAEAKARPGTAFHFNLHAGELSLAYSPYEPMRNRISKTLVVSGVKRIGHGVSIMWEDDVYAVLRRMREEKIAVEICLTSNEGILGIRGREHPFLLYRRAGVPMVLCTDDEGISRGNLTMEFVKAATWFDLPYEELKQLAFNSIEYSFLPGDSLFVDGDHNKVKETAPPNSRKAAKQQQLLRAFDGFEKRLAGEIRETFDFGVMGGGD